MEDNKYYVPTIEEFHPGFIFEAREGFHEWELGEDVEKLGNWKQYEFSAFDDWVSMSDLLTSQGENPIAVRVPYLSKEDIEAEGWVYIDEGEYQIDAYYSKKIEFSQSVIEYRLRYWGRKSHKLSIWSEDTNSTYFDGEIKNASEFKRILKMIGV